jgi:hypothetical protein
MVESKPLDALSLGVALKEKEREDRKKRVVTCLEDWHEAGVPSKGLRQMIAGVLYSAAHDGMAYCEEAPAEDVLDNFCHKLFRATCDEVMEAYAKHLLS